MDEAVEAAPGLADGIGDGGAATQQHTCRAASRHPWRSPWHPNHEDTVHATEFLTETGERPPEGARLSPKCWGRPRRMGDHDEREIR